MNVRQPNRSASAPAALSAHAHLNVSEPPLCHPTIEQRFTNKIGALIEQSEARADYTTALDLLYENLPPFIGAVFYSARNSQRISIPDFIHGVIAAYRLNDMELFYTYVYMQRFFLCCKHPSGIFDFLSRHNFARVFAFAALAAIKFLRDLHPNNKKLAQFLKNPLSDFNLCESQFIEIMGCNFHIALNVESVAAYEKALGDDATDKATLPALKYNMLADLFNLLDDHTLLQNATRFIAQPYMPLLTKEETKAVFRTTTDSILQNNNKNLRDKIILSLSQLPVAVIDYLKSDHNQDGVFGLGVEIGSKKILQIINRLKEAHAKIYLPASASAADSAKEHLLLIISRMEKIHEQYLESIKPFHTLPNAKMDNVDIGIPITNTSFATPVSAAAGSATSSTSSFVSSFAQIAMNLNFQMSPWFFAHVKPMPITPQEFLVNTYLKESENLPMMPSSPISASAPAPYEKDAMLLSTPTPNALPR